MTSSCPVISVRCTTRSVSLICSKDRSAPSTRTLKKEKCWWNTCHWQELSIRMSIRSMRTWSMNLQRPLTRFVEAFSSFRTRLSAPSCKFLSTTDTNRRRLLRGSRTMPRIIEFLKIYLDFCYFSNFWVRTLTYRTIKNWSHTGVSKKECLIPRLRNILIWIVMNCSVWSI